MTDKEDMNIEKTASGYTCYAKSDKIACRIEYIPDIKLAYIHSMPPEAGGMQLASEIENVTEITEKIFIELEGAEGLVGNYSLTSWFVDENDNQHGSPVEIDVIVLEVTDASGENYKKVFDCLKAYVIKGESDYKILSEEYYNVMHNIEYKDEE